MRALLIETHFLPSIEYCCALSGYDTIVIEKHEHFPKQTYRNRCHILTSHGIERLSIPVTAKKGKVLVSAVQIDYSYRWQTNFWRTIQSAYAKAPFFEHYADALRQELFSNEKYLFDLNQRLLSLCLMWLRYKKHISESLTYENQSAQTDMRNVISAKTDFSKRPFYTPQSYHQVFGKEFVPNLSVLDLVFCTGPEAKDIIQSSARRN